ncbi:hypothetical protein [Mariprofundus sp. KV]|uniref:hypothetical protein n=1 Tax=Mariprofundus sp. KV TaxID=2608715 RepID=UPI0015A087A0|nr:hypothetical protein [Mariprofundus sp. KV]NWF37274.1 hypothetical protein [Mariprofundus sp. KV]
MNEKMLPIATILLFIAFFSGIAVSELVIPYENNYGNNGVKTTSILFLSGIVLLWGLLSKLCKTYPQFDIWATNTLVGIAIMSFVVGVLLTLPINIFMLIPIPFWLHACISGLICFASAVVFFQSAGR